MERRQKSLRKRNEINIFQNILKIFPKYFKQNNSIINLFENTVICNYMQLYAIICNYIQLYYEVVFGQVKIKLALFDVFLLIPLIQTLFELSTIKYLSG